jgi:hypothetical protein
MPKKIIRNLQFGIGFSILILIASSLASYFSIQNQMNHRESVGKSRRVVTAVKDILVAVLDAETGNRGYQLTGQESFLEPLKEAFQNIQRHLNMQEVWRLQIQTRKDFWIFWKKCRDQSCQYEALCRKPQKRHRNDAGTDGRQ